MIRRLAGRVRRAVAARLVPRRDSIRNRVVQRIRRASAFQVIAADLARSAGGHARRGFAPSHGRPVRVGIDIRPFYEPLTGVGWYLFNLIQQFSRRDDIEMILFGDPLLTDDGPRLFVSLPSGVPLISFDLRGCAVPRMVRSVSRLAHAARALLEQPDLFFGANFFLPRSLSSIARRRVITIHDLTYRRFPELVQDETLANLQREMTREIMRADAIICVSEATRRDVMQMYQVDPSKVVAIHSGIGATQAGSAPLTELPERYLLFVGTLEPRKNLAVLLSAFESVLDSGRYPGNLVIVGKTGWKSRDLISRLQASRWRDRIHRFDYMEPDRLSTVYGRAEMFILPSIYEGFGFPILEAMSHGVPVIAARSSSLPEIGGDAAMYFDPGQPRELAELIARLADDQELRTAMAGKGRQRAAQFRWEKTAEETVAVFRRVAFE